MKQAISISLPFMLLTGKSILRSLIIFGSLLSNLCSAQISDNFSDGDFTANPAWSGDASQFIVNGSFQL
ncbi:MAG TPA: hypothetical protein VL651_16650, partial [Bacteroidia bacterium]|nr:hypothetical protein [Bacteroidia bacterium]